MRGISGVSERLGRIGNVRKIRIRLPLNEPRSTRMQVRMSEA